MWVLIFFIILNPFLFFQIRYKLNIIIMIKWQQVMTTSNLSLLIHADQTYSSRYNRTSFMWPLLTRCRHVTQTCLSQLLRKQGRSQIHLHLFIPVDIQTILCVSYHNRGSFVPSFWQENQLCHIPPCPSHGLGKPYFYCNIYIASCYLFIKWLWTFCTSGSLLRILKWTVNCNIVFQLSSVVKNSIASF